MLDYSSSFASCPCDIAKMSNGIIELFVDGGLSEEGIKKIIEGETTVEHHGTDLEIKSNKCLFIVVLHGKENNEPIDDVVLHLKLEAGLVLRDLEKKFGAWELVFSSKTSSVSFRVVGQDNKPSIIFARLFTSTPAPNSPVLSIQLRRDREPPRQDSANQPTPPN